jgi:hypothetical protein
MIKYALRCEHEHHWDAWFASMSGYDDQIKRGLVECPFCGSKSVEKAPMAPSVVTSKAARKADTANQSDDIAGQAPLPVANDLPGLGLLEPVQTMLKEMRQHIEKTHDYVGDNFAHDVRAMHDGDIDKRPIYGNATVSEVRALVEDDIPVAPLPLLASPKGVKGIH